MMIKKLDRDKGTKLLIVEIDDSNRALVVRANL